MTDFNLGDKVKEAEAILAEIQEKVPAFPFVFVYLPPATPDPCWMTSGANDNLVIGMMAKVRAVLEGNFLERIDRGKPRIQVASPADVPRIPPSKN